MQQLNRAPFVIALVLAILLVIGVLVGAKITYDNAAHQPVAMPTIDSPDADSPECTQLLQQLPEKIGGFTRVDIVQPAPAGAAAWAEHSTSRLTLRCGVGVPAQYTDYAVTETVDGINWLKIVDATPGASLATFYTIDRAPVVAVTIDAPPTASSEQQSKVAADVQQRLSKALSTLPTATTKRQPAPLAALAVEPGTESRCAPLLQALPDHLVEWSAQPAQQPQTAVWTRPGHEPIVLRCGVPAAPSYQPGAQLNQVNDIAWFTETTLANGTTAGTFYALGRTTNVALSMPQEASASAIVALSDAIEQNVAPAE